MKATAREAAVLRGAPGAGGSMRQPFRLALWLALGYFAVGLTYILFSGDAAAAFADSLAELQRIEQIKGVVFISVSSLLLFGFAFLLLRKLALHERSLTDYRDTLITAERRAAAGLFASSVAHDINNILMAIESVTDELEEAPEEERRRLTKKLISANENLKTLVARLGTAKGDPNGAVEEKFDLVSIVQRILELVRSHRKARGCRFHVVSPPGVMMLGRSTLVYQMLLNLILNAADATAGSGTIEVKLIANDGEILVEVHDDGPGVPEEERERIMEPLVTSKPDGCGLGLLSVKACAEAHRGSVEVERSELGGACFRVRLDRGGPEAGSETKSD